MKITIREKIVSYQNVEVKLGNYQDTVISKDTPVFLALIKEFLDITKWKICGTTCHQSFSDLPSYSQGGTNCANIEHLKVLVVDNYSAKVAVEVGWLKNNMAVVIMEKVNG